MRFAIDDSRLTPDKGTSERKGGKWHLGWLQLFSSALMKPISQTHHGASIVNPKSQIG